MTRAEEAAGPVTQTSEFGPQVPVIVSMTEEDFATIPTGRDFEGKKTAVLAILERHNPALAAKLRGYDCKEITAPRDADGTSYKNHIQVAVRNADKKTACAVTFSEEDRKKGSIWNCFVDKHSTPKRLCFVYVNPPKPQSSSTSSV
jgi:hypothetical protein